MEAAPDSKQMGTSTSAVVAEKDASGSSQCLVRQATPRDIPDITSIYSRFVITSTATSEIAVPEESEMLRRWRAARDHDLPYLVAELEGYIVGYCYAAQFRPREAYQYTVEDSIYVRPDCIGHGVGKLLLAQLIAQCRERACHSMVACILGVNPVSVALHAALGFQRAGLLPDATYKFGEWHDLLLMQRKL
jgi:L-amino acid N-acyltransferase YncA